MKPLAVLLGIITGSAVALAVSLGLTAVVFVLLPEDAARPEATAEQARALAENFLRTQLGRDPGAVGVPGCAGPAGR